MKICSELYRSMSVPALNYWLCTRTCSGHFIGDRRLRGCIFSTIRKKVSPSKKSYFFSPFFPPPPKQQPVIAIHPLDHAAQNESLCTEHQSLEIKSLHMENKKKLDSVCSVCSSDSCFIPSVICPVVYQDFLLKS